jgi:hypothetical protein
MQEFGLGFPLEQESLSAYALNNTPLELLCTSGGTTSRYWSIPDGRKT